MFGRLAVSMKRLAMFGALSLVAAGCGAEGDVAAEESVGSVESAATSAGTGGVPTPYTVNAPTAIVPTMRHGVEVRRVNAGASTTFRMQLGVPGLISSPGAFVFTSESCI
jgi:hypothetical protein